MPALALAQRVSADVTTLVHQAGAVAIEGRALLIEGPPGAGKSSLALALIERGGQLIGDDGVTLSVGGSFSGNAATRRLIASPPPNTTGMIEIRGVGIANLATATPAPVALVLTLGRQTERLPERPEWREYLGIRVPCLAFDPGSIAPAERARMALLLHGIDSKTG